MDFKDYIHIDEKLFHLTKRKWSYYIFLDEAIPFRTYKSKILISKIMFMAGVTRLKMPFWWKSYYLIIRYVKRNSKNRTKGTLGTKPIKSFNNTEIGKIFYQNTRPAIRKQWPSRLRQCAIFILQNNVKPLLKVDNSLLSKACICENSMKIAATKYSWF